MLVLVVSIQVIVVILVLHRALLLLIVVNVVVVGRVVVGANRLHGDCLSDEYEPNKADECEYGWFEERRAVRTSRQNQRERRAEVIQPKCHY